MVAARKIHLAKVGDIHVQRKKHMRTMRLRVDHEGRVILSIPRWVLLKSAIAFAVSKTEWILAEKSKATPKLNNGCKFGRDSVLRVLTTHKSRPSSNLTKGILAVNIPAGYSSQKADQFIKRKADELIRSQAERTILPRLERLARDYGFRYKSGSIAHLRSRWGSCDRDGNIKLSAYLVQLPEHLVDYVLLHELNHTKNMDHSRKFWHDLRAICSGTDSAKNELKEHNPRLIVSST